MKLLTLFADDARALAHIAGRRRTLDRVIARVAGCEEWGVRVLLDERHALRRADERAREEARGTSAGTGFLLRKKKTQEAARRLSGSARAEADRIFESLSAVAADHSRKRPPARPPAGAVDARGALDRASLVPAAGVARSRAAAEAPPAPLADEGYQVTLTGPWPPYHFVSVGAGAGGRSPTPKTKRAKASSPAK